jgi:hypothetical protein
MEEIMLAVVRGVSADAVTDLCERVVEWISVE